MESNWYTPIYLRPQYFMTLTWSRFVLTRADKARSIWWPFPILGISSAITSSSRIARRCTRGCWMTEQAESKFFRRENSKPISLLASFRCRWNSCSFPFSPSRLSMAKKRCRPKADPTLFESAAESSSQLSHCPSLQAHSNWNCWSSTFFWRNWLRDDLEPSM